MPRTPVDYSKTIIYKIVCKDLSIVDLYVGHTTDLEKINYIKRHQENPLEKKLIKNLVLSPSVLSLYLLWNTKDMDENIKILNELFRKNYDKL